MIIIAASLYLPEHVATMLSRAWFYYHGDEAAAIAGENGGGAGAVGFGRQKFGGAGGGRNGQDVIDMLGKL